MLKFTLALALLVPSLAQAASPQSNWTGQVELAQSNGVNSQTGRSDFRDKPRPQRYYCQLDNGGGCPASAGRVGERCRCANQTGSGRLTSY